MENLLCVLGGFAMLLGAVAFAYCCWEKKHPITDARLEEFEESQRNNDDPGIKC